MKTKFAVLSREEIEMIHDASMAILSTVGIKVEYKIARDIFRSAGAGVDEHHL
ncbi:MAG: trimethylamine methyltransferase family protein [Bacillota bacterium]